MTLVEKVAEAIGKFAHGSIEWLSQRDREDIARIAIAAMREPTDRMVRSAYSNTTVPKMWGQMIDTALSESPE